MNNGHALLFQISLIYLCAGIYGGETNSSNKIYEKFEKRFLGHQNNTKLQESNTVPTAKFTKDKVHIEVYYETKCPASVIFFKNQLRPVVMKLPEFLKVDLVPFGFATSYRSRGKIHFECHHGPWECFINRINACAVDVLRRDKEAVLFNSCVLDFTDVIANAEDFDYIGILNWCGYKLQLKTTGLRKCVRSERGSILLKKYDELTKKMNPASVPYIVVDGSTDFQDNAIRDLLGTVCKLLKPLPQKCIVS